MSYPREDNRNPMRFNGSLPINIKVLEKLNFDRYKILLGTREFTTKSQKELEQGAKYWGSFAEGKAGIITISNLIKKPNYLQSDSYFLDIDLKDFLTQLAEVPSPISTFKEWILESLAKDETGKTQFLIYSDMLLALKEGIIHLPLKYNDTATILQVKLSNSNMEFYCAYENLGALRGYVSKGNFDLEVLFNQTLFFLKEVDIASYIKVSKPIDPLYNSEKLMLDLKG